jgi:hypothetical protein
MRAELNRHGQDQRESRELLRASVAHVLALGGSEGEFMKIWFRDRSVAWLYRWMTGVSIVPWWVRVYLEEGPPGMCAPLGWRGGGDDGQRGPPEPAVPRPAAAPTPGRPDFE